MEWTFGGTAYQWDPTWFAAWASWVQAIGGILAVGGAAWIGIWQQRQVTLRAKYDRSVSILDDQNRRTLLLNLLSAMARDAADQFRRHAENMNCEVPLEFIGDWLVPHTLTAESQVAEVRTQLIGFIGDYILTSAITRVLASSRYFFTSNLARLDADKFLEAEACMMAKERLKIDAGVLDEIAAKIDGAARSSAETAEKLGATIEKARP